MNDIVFQVDGDIAELRLTRSAKRNALSRQMIQQILKIQEQVRQVSVRGLLITAEGPVFCAGHDFADMAGANIDTMRVIFQDCQTMMLGFQALPVPVMAAVNGPAIGAGCQLALAADLVVASTDATFQTPGGRGAWFCTTPMTEVMKNLAPKRALEMLFTGEPITAETALTWGMVNRVVPTEKVNVVARELLELACRGSLTSKATGKQTYYTAASLPRTEAYDLATEVMATTGTGEEAQVAMQGIVSKQRKAL